jgi:hypothetical protein
VSWGPDIGTPFLQEKEVDKITSPGIDASKPDFTVTTQAAATLTLGAGEIGIYIGTLVKADHTILVPGTAPIGSNQRAVAALDHIRDHLRESQYPQGPLQFTGAFFTPPTKFPTDALNAAAFPAFTEDQVVIAYDLAFYDAGNSTNFNAMIQSMIEVYQEQVLSFN